MCLGACRGKAVTSEAAGEGGEPRGAAWAGCEWRAGRRRDGTRIAAERAWSGRVAAGTWVSGLAIDVRAGGMASLPTPGYD